MQIIKQEANAVRYRFVSMIHNSTRIYKSGVNITPNHLGFSNDSESFKNRNTVEIDLFVAKVKVDTDKAKENTTGLIKIRDVLQHIDNATHIEIAFIFGIYQQHALGLMAIGKELGFWKVTPIIDPLTESILPQIKVNYGYDWENGSPSPRKKYTAPTTRDLLLR